MKAKNCDECRYWFGGIRVCYMNHKPRFFENKTGNPHNTDWGWKRKCEDFEAKNETTSKPK